MQVLHDPTDGQEKRRGVIFEVIGACVPTRTADHISPCPPRSLLPYPPPIFGFSIGTGGRSEEDQFVKICKLKMEL